MGARERAMKAASGMRAKAGREMIAGSEKRLYRKGRTARWLSGPPRLNSTTAMRVLASGACDTLHHPFDVRDRRVRQEAVAEVEDVGARSPLLEKLIDPRVQGGAAGAQQKGIEGP